LIDFPQDLIHKLRTTERVVAMTGAGASAESGVATFREAQTGLWAKYRPEDLATPEAFQQDPQRVWDWYQWRRGLIRDVEPNQGHYALAEMEEKLLARSASFLLVTQNVDGLHRKAGSQHILEIHGNIQQTRCATCLTPVETWEERHLHPPDCPKCGGLLRPNVVWFGESLSKEALNQAVITSKACEIFFSIGTSNLVQPAASLPVIALQSGAMVVEINPNPTPISRQVTYSFRGCFGDIMPEIVQTAWG
jgi:NAD-dependent deacetylase